MTSEQETSWEAHRDTVREAMFDLLNRAGFERVKVDYDGGEDEDRVDGWQFHGGSGEVPADAVPADIRHAVEQYMYACLGWGWWTQGECFGTLRLYPRSKFAYFDHNLREVTWDSFSDGKPGPEVPDGDRDRQGVHDDEDDEYEDDEEFDEAA
jgi:hypothetical protein